MRYARTTALLVLLGLGLALLAQTYARARRPQGNDLTARLMAAEALRRGDDPYAITAQQGHGPYLLTIDVFLIPWTFLPAWLAQALWFAANVAALAGSLAILESLWLAGADRSTLRLPFSVRLAGLALGILVPLQSHLTLGQVTFLVVLLPCCLFLRAHLAGRAITASMWLGGAVTMKLTPGIFAFGLAATRRYWTLALTAGWILVWAVALPLLVSGRVLDAYLHAWPQALGSRVGAVLTFHRESRFSLAAALVYLWPGLASIPGLRAWAALAVLGPIVWLQRRTEGDRRGELVVFGLNALAMLLISPLSETHHLAVLVAPLWVWLLTALADRAGRAADFAGGTLFLAFHWLGVRRFYFFDFLALVVLYTALLARGARLASSSRSAA